MEIIKIDKNNIQLIVQNIQSAENKEFEFLNAL